MLFQHEQREQKVLKTEKGVCISRADRKWPNRHKMLATGYLDTDREKEGTTGNTSGFWRLAGKPFTKASVRHYALEDLKHRVSRDFQWSDRYLRKEFSDKKAKLEEQTFRSFRLLCFTRNYHSCFRKKHFSFICSLPYCCCSYCEFWASPLYFPKHKITQKCFKRPSSLFGSTDAKMGTLWPASSFIIFQC